MLTQWRLDSAIVYYKKALALYKPLHTTKQIADIHEKIAESYRKNYDLNDAMHHAERALEIRLCNYDKKHPKIALSYNSIGHILKEQDKFTEAMDQYQKALEIQLDNFERTDYRISDCYHNIGTIHHILAKYDDALRYYRIALTYRLHYFGRQHPKIAFSLHTDLNYQTQIRFT